MITPQPSLGPDFHSANGVNRIDASLDPIDMHATLRQVDVVLLQCGQLGAPQAAAIGPKDACGFPVFITAREPPRNTRPAGACRRASCR